MDTTITTGYCGIQEFRFTTKNLVGQQTNILARILHGDFGTFDVELTFSSNYVVEATGMLQNKDEVMPETLRQKLDIKNFADNPWGIRLRHYYSLR